VENFSTFEEAEEVIGRVAKLLYEEMMNWGFESFRERNWLSIANSSKFKQLTTE
jgi:hypothetical protein